MDMKRDECNLFKGTDRGTEEIHEKPVRIASSVANS
jgi:hypothetical protein